MTTDTVCVHACVCLCVCVYLGKREDAATQIIGDMLHVCVGISFI